MRYFWFFFCILSQISFSQNNPDAKRDYNWVFGYPDSIPDCGSSVMYFATSPPITYSDSIGINLYLTNSVISDTNGNLLFYTNGKCVTDRLFNVMPHGDSINFGYVYTLNTYGYPLVQGAIILPYPEHYGEYFIIHEREVLDPDAINLYKIDGLYYTKVDMSLNNGLGDIVLNQKNVPILQDTLDFGKICAVRHGNGRDWWIIIREYGIMNCFYRILLSPSGFTNYGTQCMGNSNVIAVPKGQNVFSPDGSVFARSYCSNIPSTLYFEIYSFDRCAGSFINLSTFNSGVPSILTDGLAISPDSHYLYSSDQSSLRQFDLNAPNISSSQQLIAVNDSLGGFFQSQLAPDGRIYIVYASSTQLSVINQPDSAGVLCDFQAHSFTLPTINNLSMPNLPNFRLGKLVGSVCDTLIVSVTNQQYRNNSIKAYPNPASDFVSFSLDIVSNNAPMKLEIFNSLSQKVKEMNLSPYQGIVRLDVRNFAPGIYFAVFKNGEEVLAQCKFSTCK